MSSSATDSDEAEHARRRTRGGENRWPPAIAVAAAIGVYAALPTDLLIAPRVIIPIIEGLLLVAVVLVNPRRMTRQTSWSRASSMALAVVVIAANLSALGLLIDELTRPHTQGGRLLLAALQVWATNVLGFALLYWELDRDGPVARREVTRKEMSAADFRFSQDENDDAVAEVAVTSSIKSGWVPTFVDYLYLSLTNSSAFSPTDTMPLSSRAKVLMGIEATAALVTSLLVIARAVGTINGS